MKVKMMIQPMDHSVWWSKKDKGNLAFDCEWEDGRVLIHRIGYVKDSTLLADTAESQTKLAKLYPGPYVQELEPTLVELWGDYLSDRGINEEMAYFISDYSAFKEQAEYVGWLKQMKNFVE